MTSLLLVYNEDREQIGRNDSSHSSLKNSSRRFTTITLSFAFSVLLLAGCASDRSSEQHRHPRDTPFFDTPSPEDTYH